jgi:hypothetical protein
VVHLAGQSFDPGETSNLSVEIPVLEIAREPGASPALRGGLALLHVNVDRIILKRRRLSGRTARGADLWAAGGAPSGRGVPSPG